MFPKVAFDAIDALASSVFCDWLTPPKFADFLSDWMLLDSRDEFDELGSSFRLMFYLVRLSVF